MSEAQMELRWWRAVPPGDFARPGLVDRGFVERSVAALRGRPDAESVLHEGMTERLESIRAIDRLYEGELNEWAAATRERLWLEYFAGKAILQDLQLRPSLPAA
ncbi:MAG: hypothetical protein HY674_06220 [Chloroflexi bacterium]|nr:hypothetical protein [Chloroflexota bacterium]